MFPAVFRETIACVQYVIRLFMDVRSLVFLRVEHCLSGLPVIVISKAFCATDTVLFEKVKF